MGLTCEFPTINPGVLQLRNCKRELWNGHILNEMMFDYTYITMIMKPVLQSTLDDFTYKILVLVYVAR